MFDCEIQPNMLIHWLIERALAIRRLYNGPRRWTKSTTLSLGETHKEE
jgi:hypothetical protein